MKRCQKLLVDLGQYNQNLEIQCPRFFDLSNRRHRLQKHSTQPVVSTCNDNSFAQRNLNTEKMLNRSNSITVECVPIAESQNRGGIPKMWLMMWTEEGLYPTHGKRERRWRRLLENLLAITEVRKKVISCDFVKQELRTTTRNHDCSKPQHDHKSKSRLLLRRSLQLTFLH